MKLHYGDLTDSTNLVKIINEVKSKQTHYVKIDLVNLEEEGKRVHFTSCTFICFSVETSILVWLFKRFLVSQLND